MSKNHCVKILKQMETFYQSRFTEWNRLYEDLKLSNRHCAVLNKYYPFDTETFLNTENTTQFHLRSTATSKHEIKIRRDESIAKYFLPEGQNILPSLESSSKLYWVLKSDVDSNEGFVTLRRIVKNTCGRKPNNVRLLLSDFFKSPYVFSKNKILPYYLLDLSSLLPVLGLEIQPDDRVLDMCAAPGGKTVAIMQFLSLKGQLVSNDVTKGRFNRLKKVIKEYLPLHNTHKSNVTITNWDGQQFGTEEVRTFDKVLVDAPCSSERHVIQKHFQYGGWSVKKMNENAKLQVKLLLSALKTVKPGGIVVYSTCSISPLENDEVIDKAVQTIRQHKDMLFAVDDTCSLIDSTINQLAEGTFNYLKTRHGILVLPSECCNWGPMYVSRIFRIT